MTIAALGAASGQDPPPAAGAGEARPPLPRATDCERRCIASGEVVEVARLLRFVVDPGGEVVFDATRRLPGRGLWVKADGAALAAAIRRKGFQRAARRPVIVADDLAARVEALVLGRCLDLLGLARRAGEAVFGFERVRAALAEGRARLLLAAADGDPRDRARLRQLAADLPIIDVLSADELGRATGRPRTVHGAVAAGRLAGAIFEEASRLAGLRAPMPEGGTKTSERTGSKWRT